MVDARDHTRCGAATPAKWDPAPGIMAGAGRGFKFRWGRVRLAAMPGAMFHRKFQYNGMEFPRLHLLSGLIKSRRSRIRMPDSLSVGAVHICK